MKKYSTVYWSSFVLGFGSAAFLGILILSWQSQTTIVKYVLGLVSFASFIVALEQFHKYKKPMEN